MAYFLLLILLVVNFISTILLFNRIRPSILPYEIIVVGILLLVSILSLYGTARRKTTSCVVLAIVFALGLLNTIYLSFSIKSSLITLLIIVNALGFIVSILSIKPREKKDFKIETYEPEEDLKVEEIKPTKLKVSKSFKPGKYLASKSSTYYHAPKCEWAKKISKKNRLWLSDDKEARSKGYKKHDCLKKR